MTEFLVRPRKRPTSFMVQFLSRRMSALRISSSVHSLFVIFFHFDFAGAVTCLAVFGYFKGLSDISAKALRFIDCDDGDTVVTVWARLCNHPHTFPMIPARSPPTAAKTRNLCLTYHFGASGRFVHGLFEKGFMSSS